MSGCTIGPKGNPFYAVCVHVANGTALPEVSYTFAPDDLNQCGEVVCAACNEHGPDEPPVLICACCCVKAGLVLESEFFA